MTLLVTANVGVKLADCNSSQFRIFSEQRQHSTLASNRLGYRKKSIHNIQMSYDTPKNYWTYKWSPVACGKLLKCTKYMPRESIRKKAENLVLKNGRGCICKYCKYTCKWGISRGKKHFASPVYWGLLNKEINWTPLPTLKSKFFPL